MKIIFIGISNKENKEALDANTATGKIIWQIENALNSYGIECVKTNLVSSVPLDEAGKIRYPNALELGLGVELTTSLIKENSPCLVFLLGRIVEKSMRGICIEGTTFIPLKHPSYISVYKRMDIPKYVDEAIEFAKNHFGLI
jgi:uracil-DNA glycosylase